MQLKRCCIFVFLLAGFFVLLPGTSFAASSLDDAYQHSDTISLAYDGPSGSCPHVDLSTDWMTPILALNNPASQSFNNAITSGGSWAVTQQHVDTGSIERFDVFVAWTEDHGELSFYDSGGAGSHRVALSSTSSPSVTRALTISARPDVDNCTPKVADGGYVSSRATWDISTNDPLTAAPTTTFMNVFVSGATINYPAGYEGMPIATELPPVKYVAMGDSFSSGEGNPPFEYGTATSSNTCHRSPQAWPRQLEFDSSLNLGGTAFVACSGATTDNVLNGQNGEPPQVDAVSDDANVVTLTIGGNNIGFGDFAYACVYSSCNSSSNEYQEAWSIMTDLTRSDYLPSRLESLFANIAYRLSLNPNVKVYVVGYPYVMTHASWEDRGIGICSDFDEDEASAVEAIVLKLDTVINTAVTDFGDPRFVYVDPLATGSPFLGHELCRGGSYFNGTEAGISNSAYVFHPNENGQQAYANLIMSYMNL